MGAHAAKFERNRHIIQRLKDGSSTSQISREFGLTQERVRQIGISAGVWICRADERAERNRQIIERVRAGVPDGAISREFRMPSAKIRLLCMIAGVQRAPATIRKILPSRECVLALFEYNAESGELAWRKTGCIAGSLHSHRGQRRVTIAQSNFLTHRLVWLYVHGEPVPYEIDHIDGNDGNNRISNLRAAARSQNAANSRRSKGNNTGYKGVSCRRGTETYTAHITCQGKTYNLGSFSTPQAAHAAYVAKARQLFGEFARSE